MHASEFTQQFDFDPQIWREEVDPEFGAFYSGRALGTAAALDHLDSGSLHGMLTDCMIEDLVSAITVGGEVEVKMAESAAGRLFRSAELREAIKSMVAASGAGW